jgi:hypothetical protein
MNRRRFSIIDAIDDRNLFAGWFKDRATWSSWFVFLRALFGLPLAPKELALFTECTGRAVPPTQPAAEGWLICGRRSGKSFMLALCAVYLAAFHRYRQYLAPGERGVILIVASDRKQARVIFRYIRALLQQVPMLRKMLERETADAFDLNNGISIEIMAASYRSLRGYTVIAALLDELAFWPTDDSANPDTEIINAIRPAMATIPNAMLLCASSPYAQRGALFDAFRRHFGKGVDLSTVDKSKASAPGDLYPGYKSNDPPRVDLNAVFKSNDAGRGGSSTVEKPNDWARVDLCSVHKSILVWRAPTRTMNPTVPQSVIDAALESDPASAAAEYMAQFRTDVETFVSRDVVEAAVIQGRHELPRIEHTRYHAFVDPSGGSSDSMTLAIAHMSGNRVIIDAIRERRAPFSPDDVVKEFADTLKAYGISRVHGDKYASEWPRERFRVHEVEYRISDRVKSELYLALLPLLNSNRIELLDHPRLINQLVGLERRTARSGRDTIDHVPGSFDDVCNSVAGAAVIAAAAAAQPQIPLVAPAIWSSRLGWLSGESETWRDYAGLPDVARLTQGLPPGSGPREW